MNPSQVNHIAEQLARRGLPGGNPGRHLATENIRAQLLAIGMKPNEGRKAALFQLAADMPAPVLGELIGISNNAAQWARLDITRLARLHRQNAPVDCGLLVA